MLKIADHYCPACGERREDLVRDDEVVPCPSCGKPMHRGLASPTLSGMNKYGQSQ
tara:strand:- start:317 stop:481 length:165 start_codon:yes stop_codon:yes gene_type:complete